MRESAQVKNQSMKLVKLLLITLLLSLTACDSKKSITTIDNPELVTIAFFNALYNEKNVEKAAKVCSPQLARILLHYHSAKAIGRHMFNMSFDTVEISPENSGIKLREQFKNTAVITVYFNGFYQEDIIKDVKRVSLIQQDGKWIINKLLQDPF